MTFIDPRGAAVLHSNSFPAPALNFSDREYFRVHLERRMEGFHVGVPVFGRVVQEWLNVYSSRVEDARGNFLGVVAAAVAIPHLENLYAGLNLGPDGRVLLFRADGILLAMHPAMEGMVGRSFAGLALFAQAAARPDAFAQRGAGLVDDKPHIIASRSLQGFPLVIAVSSTQDHVLSGWRRDAWRIGAGATGIAVILGLALFVLLRQRRVDEELVAEVRDSETRWRAAMEGAGHGVWDWDVKSGAVYRSPHYHQLLGYADGEIPAGNEGWLQLLHPEDRKLSHQVNRACVDGEKESFSAELRLRCKDGSWKWLLNRGTVVGRDEHGRARRVLGTITDLTEHRQAQQQLRESAARLHGVIESAMDAIITVDERQRIVMFNAAAEKVFRCSAAEAVGTPLDRFIPERFRERHRAHLRAFGATGTTTRMMGAQLDLRGLRADGEEFPIDASISQVAVGGTKFYTVILRDITERRRAEADLERTHQELRGLSTGMNEVREAERARIARELHDELAQSLTALKMDVSWLAGRLPSGDDRAQSRIERMKGLVDATVTSVRQLAHDLRPAMLDDLGLVPAIEHLLHEFSERAGVVVELDADAGEVEFREPLTTSVYRMVQEALTNVARHARATEVRVAIRADGDELSVTASDNGIGITLAKLQSGKSLGILGIKERARTLGGNADVRSLPEGGTVVEVRIPVRQYRATGAGA
jgi:PAS domain S-box-containing protein